MWLKITLEQWRALLAVVDEGGYAAAAEALDKSQSSVSYAINKLEESLGVRVFRLEGRKAALTPAGRLLYRRAQVLVKEAQALERSASFLSERHEAEIAIAVETIFPQRILLDALAELNRLFPDTRVEIYETVLTGTTEAILQKQVNLAISSAVPPGFMGERLYRTDFIPVAAPQHPLHSAESLTFEDLAQYRQLVIRDSGAQRKANKGWLGAEKRWTFSHISSSVEACVQGYGFAWYPQEKIRDELDRGSLCRLPLIGGAARSGDLYLVLTEGDYSGPAVQQFTDILRRQIQTAQENQLI